MGLSWYRTDSAYHRHPKMLALKTELKEPLADAYVSRLWSWTQVYAPSGRFSSAVVAGLESELLWTGIAGVLAAALEKTGWLDRSGDDFEVHDWPDYQNYYVKKSKKDADKKRKRRSRLSARTESGRRADGAAPSGRTAPPTDGRTDGRYGRTDVTDGQVKKPLSSELDLELVDAPPLTFSVVFDHWRKVMGHPDAKAVAKRRKAVAARLKEGYTVEQLKAAIDGCSKTPHNMGQNDRHERYDDLELICRDGAHVERFLTKTGPTEAPTQRPEGKVTL